MAVNRVPVLKRCRSLGMDPVYLGIDKKSTRQLKRANRKMSEYGLQLREKQKAKFIYGVLEKPFVNYYKKADRMEGQTGENLMILLELRLDNVLFRMGMARTRKEARQIVDHKHVLVNGKQVNIPSYLVSAGDTIEIKEGKKSSQRYKDIVEVTGGRLTPEWIEADLEALKGVVKERPTREMIDVPVDEVHYRARGIADGRGNGKLNVPQARITQDHGQDIHSRGGQIGDDIRNAERRARGDEKKGVRAHYNAHSHDHLPMAVFIVGPGAQLGEQVRTAPEQNRNQGKNKPCHM